jgi:hypothetical protein
MSKFTDWILDKTTKQEGLELTGTCPILLEDMVWEDKAYPLAGRRLSSSVGTVDNDWDEMAVEFSPNGDIADLNDLVGVSSEHPHAADENGFIYPHIHFWQPAGEAYVFTAEYRIQDNNEAKTTAWTSMTAEVATDATFTYTSGTLNQIVYFHQTDAGRTKGIDMTGHSLSATIQFRFTRTDAIAGNISATFFDFHVSYKRLGSATEGAL